MKVLRKSHKARGEKESSPRRVPFPRARYLTRKERIALKAYKEYLLEQLPDQIERIVLFGSKARGDSRRWSDVDLLVAVSGPPIKGLGSLDPRWHAIVDPILAHIQKEGVALWRRRKKATSN